MARNLTKKEDMAEDIGIARSMIECWERKGDEAHVARKVAEEQVKIDAAQANIDTYRQELADAPAKITEWRGRLTTLRQKLALEQNKAPVAKLKDLTTRVAEMQREIEAQLAAHPELANDPAFAGVMATMKVVPTPAPARQLRLAQR